MDSVTGPSISSPAKGDGATEYSGSNENTSLKSDMERLISWIMNREERELGIIGLAVGLIVVHCLVPRIISWSSILVGVLGMTIGGFFTAFYLLAVPEDTRLKRAQRIATFGKHYDRGFEIIDGVPSWSNAIEKRGEDAKDKSLIETENVDLQRVRISPDIDPMVEEMISFMLRDFVNEPIGLVSEGQHNIPLRASLVAMAMNISSRLFSMQLPETALLGVFGLQNSFIVHLRAYRELRASRLPIAEYVKRHANSNSVLGRCYRKEERIKQIRSIARDICQSLLPKKDQQSVALFAVLQEIVATHAIESSLEHICDPDFVNMSIIDYFNTPSDDSKQEVSGTGSNSKGSSAALINHPEAKMKESPITSLADSILMNAAHLMGKGKTEKQGVDTDIMNIPARPATPDRSSLSSDGSIAEETDAVDRQTTTEVSKPPAAVTLKQILKHKNNHIDAYQEFMTYLQVWDAMDFAQFWMMVDVFHRQIEQGDLNSLEALRQEASSIYETYCGSDLDHNLNGIREAKSGSLIKNLKRNMQRDPANCFREPQEWALGVLETQYWVPFNIKRESEHTRKAKEQQQAEPSQTTPSQPQENGSQEPAQVAGVDTLTSSTPASDGDSSVALDSNSEATPPNPIRSKVQSIQVTDMANGNRKSKILMSSTELSYMIEIQTEGGQGWVITRTFQQLEQLQSFIIQTFPGVQRTAFPRWRLQPSEKVCNGLQRYMNSLLAIPEVSDSPGFAWFLSKEFNDNPDASAPGSGSSPNIGSGFISAITPISENTAAFGAAAAQGAKSAFRQASEASLSAGRFFKSLGNAVGSGSSPQLSVEDRNGRGSFESEKSIRSVSSALALPDQRHMNGSMSLSSTLPPVQDEEFDIHRRPSYISDTSSVGRQAPMANKLARPRESSLSSSFSTFSQAPEPFNDNLEKTPTHPVIRTDVAHNRSSSAVSSGAAAPAALATPISPSTPTTEPVKKSSVPLLSNDELDLLIETTFTVLEDMMDFSKSQSIRRMTFGMLRELVRKSYRTAINQSFSAWVEQNTSHEKATEIVRWLKEDLLWPNGVWPESETKSASATPESLSGKERGSVHSKDEQYEGGADGIAVKVSSIPQPHNAATSTSMPSTTTLIEAATMTTATAQAATPGARTQQEKDATRNKARELVKVMLPGSLVTVLGKEAVQRGLVDVFEMFQIKELNQGLVLGVLEMTIRLIFTR
ncbi:hypothetical protein BGX34_011182 [Mortierella sp. NVP85]|nr:hypothetical protein BGX34_011182 [Mortierella sp. NVP85]